MPVQYGVNKTPRACDLETIHTRVILSDESQSSSHLCLLGRNIMGYLFPVTAPGCCVLRQPPMTGCYN